MLNIKEAPYNAKYDGSDETAVLNAAITDAYNAGGGKVYVPGGTIVGEPTLKSKVKIVGDGMRTSYIKAVAGSTRKYAVDIDGGAVIHSGLEDIGLTGVNNAGQGGFGALASKGSQASGGLWYSAFVNVDIRGFAGPSWSFIGGHDSSAMTPNQFLTFIECYGSRASNSQALLMEGQCEHFTFIGCSFEAGNPSNKGIGWGAILQRKRDALGNVMGDAAPGVVQFINGVYQNGDIGMKVERATDILYLGCWFENMAHAFYASHSAKVTIEKSRFANAGQDGSGTGYCVGAVGDARVTVEDCTFTGTQDRTYMVSSPKSITTRGNVGEVNVAGITGQFGVNASNTVDIRGLKTALVNATATPLKTILTDANVGESIYITAWGSGQTLTLQTGGNLTLGAAGSLTMNHKQVATFTRFDLGGALMLTGLTP